MTATLPRAASHPDALPGTEGRDLRTTAQVHAEAGRDDGYPVAAHGKPRLLRLREDLTVSQQVTSEGVIFVIKDPLLDRFYRFPQEAHFIASQLDGKTELEVVRK